MSSLEDLDDEQLKSFHEIEEETSPIFVTGPAGTGKSTLLRALRDNSKDAENALVVAFTGVAALNVEGMTIHSLALRTSLGDYEINVYRPLSAGRELSTRNRELASHAKLLIIDEVSMARADLIDALDRFFRLAKDSNLPFGGVRVVMFGDLRQLPPFIIEHQLTRKEKQFLSGYENSRTPHFFCAHVFSISGLKTLELKVIKRQTDALFIENLNELRGGKPGRSVMDYFNTQARKTPSQNSIRLFAQRQPAKRHNKAKLASISGDIRTYKALLAADESTFKALLGRTQNNPAPDFLELKVGARVMVLRNLSVSQGLVNGAGATVQALNDNSVTIELDGNGSFHEIGRSSWDIFGPQIETIQQEDGSEKAILVRKKIGEYIQFPLMLAWAVTIHKAQGKTLEEACIDFDGDYHSPGQAYVAVSRLRSIAGLSFMGEMTREHVKPFDQVLERFLRNPNIPSRLAHLQSELSVLKLDHEANVADAPKRIEEILPWVRFDAIVNQLSEPENMVQTVNRAGFHLGERLRYLNQQYGLTPHDYLLSEYLIDSDGFEIIITNIDRALRNRVQLIDMGEWTEINSDEVYLRRNLEVTGLEFARFSLALGRKGAISFLKEHHVGKVEHGILKLQEILRDQKENWRLS